MCRRRRLIQIVRLRRTPKLLSPLLTLHSQRFTLCMKQVLVWTGIRFTTRCASPPSFPLGHGPMGALNLILVGQAKPSLPKVLLRKTLARRLRGGPPLAGGDGGSLPFHQEVA